MDQERYVTEKKVSNLTGLALSTLRNWRSAGVGLPYVKCGRAVRYSLRDVMDFMEAHKIKPDDY